MWAGARTRGPSGQRPSQRFSPFSTGCHVIIADGLKGTDEAIVPVNGEYVNRGQNRRAVMDADIVVSLNPF
jgi:uncharacterized Fe-S center protein